MLERRAKSRIQISYPAVVRGSDAVGTRFKTRGLTENLSASGMYLRVPQSVEPGTGVLIVLQLSASTSALSQSSPRIAARGTVVRAESRPDGTCGLGIKFEHHRFL